MSVIPKIVWPVPSNNHGGDFGPVEEVLAHLDGEATGTWLLGLNGMWHGGIHITDTTTPWCALSGKAATETVDYPVPYKGEQALRCMADGEVVAYRVCQDYMTLDWFTGPLHCSGSFVLVRHYIQPGETEKSGLHFYTMYMHLAPYSAYDAQGGKRWITRDTLSAYGEMDWLTMKLSGQSRKPDTAGSVKTGTRITWDENDPAQTEARYGRTYGLVTLAEDSGKLKAGERVWMVVDNHNIAPDAGSRPSWWKHLAPPAREAMQFDTVVSLAEPYAIKAGDSVGHLGYFESPKENGYDARYQVHIECFSTDDNLETFLTNPEKAGEKNPQYLKYTQGMKLFRWGLKGEEFTEDDRPTRGAGILTLSKVEVKEEAGEKYYRIRPEGGYVQSPELLSQYDLGKLGFSAVTESPESFDHLDQKTPPKGLVERIYQFLLRAATDDARPSHALVRYNYEQLLNRITRGDSPYSGPEYLRAAHNPSYRDVLQRMIVKHPSEWWHEKGDAIWQSFLVPVKKNAPLWGKYSEAFLDKMVWMQDVTTEKLRSELWHMHPVMFLGAIKGAAECEITVELIEKLLGHTDSWFTGKRGGKIFAAHFKNNYPEVYEFDKNNFVRQFNGQLIAYGITGPYHKAHFLSQCLHESAHFDTTLEFGSGHNYDPGQHPDAIKNGNTVVGDGPRYKGRGLIQLTWKKNYQRFSNDSGNDCVNNSDLVASIMDNAIKASCWFWRNNGGVHKKYDARGDINTLIDHEKNNVELVTLAVNGGQKGLSERQMYFNAIKKEWGLD